MSDRLIPRMRPYQHSIFGQMSLLAAETGSVNLGQGFPDVDGPAALKSVAITSIEDGSGNQYPPVHGLMDLRNAVAEHQHRFYGVEVDPVHGVVITTGASEALSAAMLALVAEGDEVIALEPWFDLYASAIALAGGVRVGVPLRRTDAGFRLDVDALAAAITERTKILLVNTPHNPTGMVLTRSEIDAVAALAVEHDLIVIADEVYEHLVFAPAEHVPLATHPDLADRTISIGSGGKSFSFTGWKVGWASGPEDLISAVRTVRQHMSYTSGGPFQQAIAAGLRLPDAYFDEFRSRFESQRDLLAGGLAELGFEVIPSYGSYFLLTDVGPVGRARGWDGLTLARELPHLAGVTVIPVQVFYDDPNEGAEYVRWTFCKQPAVLQQALDRLAAAGQ